MLRKDPLRMLQLLCTACCAMLALMSIACGGMASRDGERAATNNASGNPANSPATGASPVGASSSIGNDLGVAEDPSKYDAEIAQLVKQAERSPGDDVVRAALAEAYVRRANALRQGGRFREAERDYQNALRSNPDNEEAQQGVANIAHQADREPTGENGEPAPLPITPNATTGDEEPSPATEPSPRKRKS